MKFLSNNKIYWPLIMILVIIFWIPAFIEVPEYLLISIVIRYLAFALFLALISMRILFFASSRFEEKYQENHVTLRVIRVSTIFMLVFLLSGIFVYTNTIVELNAKPFLYSCDYFDKHGNKIFDTSNTIACVDLEVIEETETFMRISATQEFEYNTNMIISTSDSDYNDDPIEIDGYLFESYEYSLFVDIELNYDDQERLIYYNIDVSKKFHFYDLNTEKDFDYMISTKRTVVNTFEDRSFSSVQDDYRDIDLFQEEILGRHLDMTDTEVRTYKFDIYEDTDFENEDYDSYVGFATWNYGLENESINQIFVERHYNDEQYSDVDFHTPWYDSVVEFPISIHQSFKGTATSIYKNAIDYGFHTTEAQFSKYGKLYLLDEYKESQPGLIGYDGFEKVVVKQYKNLFNDVTQLEIYRSDEKGSYKTGSNSIENTSYGFKLGYYQTKSLLDQAITSRNYRYNLFWMSDLHYLEYDRLLGYSTLSQWTLVLENSPFFEIDFD